MKAIEFLSQDIKCDNPKCDWVEKNVEDYSIWLNKPCPKCGENVLTEQDYNAAKKIHELKDFLNNLTEEDMIALQNEEKEEERSIIHVSVHNNTITIKEKENGN